MIPYRASCSAQRDLLEIFTYWAERASISVADRIIMRITARFKLLAEHPMASASHIAAKVRCFPVGEYPIYYRKTRRSLEFLHIFHGAGERKLILPREDLKL
jgi:plasmid stabilization system protein ParE